MMDSLKTIDVVHTDGGLKSIGKSILSHILSISVVLLLIVMVGSAFFEITPVIGKRLAYNSMLFVAAVLIGERMTLILGSEHGKKDPSVKKAIDAFRSERDRIIDNCGTERIHEYCKVAVSSCYAEAVTAACDRCGIDESDYIEIYRKHSLAHLILRDFGISRLATAVRVYRIRKIRKITLSTAQIISDSSSRFVQHAISETGNEYTERVMFSPLGILASIFFTVFLVGIGFQFVGGVSPEKIIYIGSMLFYTLYKMGIMYIRGLRAYPDVHTAALDGKLYHLREYERFCKMTKKEN